MTCVRARSWRCRISIVADACVLGCQGDILHGLRVISVSLWFVFVRVGVEKKWLRSAVASLQNLGGARLWRESLGGAGRGGAGRSGADVGYGLPALERKFRAAGDRSAMSNRTHHPQSHLPVGTRRGSTSSQLRRRLSLSFRSSLVQAVHFRSVNNSRCLYSLDS